jgi:hypothetical protein
MDFDQFDERANEEASDKGTPYRRPLKIWRPLERLNPAKRGGLFIAPTRAVYSFWKRAQRWSSTRKG